MALKLDHIVHLVQDLGTATETFRRLGLHVVPGGEHPAWGTHNALSYCDLTYVEWMAVRDPAVAAGSDLGGAALQMLSRLGEGPATVALATDDTGAPYEDEQLGARCAASPAGILLCEPTGPGPAQDSLAQRGEGPFLIDFGTAGRLIPPDQAHGAWLRVVGKP